MELTENIKEKIKNHAFKDTERECCGLILADGSVIPCINRASDFDVHFIIAAGDIKKAQKKSNVVAVYHSHVPAGIIEDRLSDEDLVISEYFNVKTVLYSLIQDKFYEYTPTGKPIGYIGRPYIRGVLDEFVLIKDYYEKILNIQISDLTNRNTELFLKNNGFAETNGPQKHDVLLIRFQNKIDNRHMTIYTENNKIIIHPEFELSKEVNYNYGLQKWTEKIYRHHKM